MFIPEMWGRLSDLSKSQCYSSTKKMTHGCVLRVLATLSANLPTIRRPYGMHCQKDNMAS